MAVIIVDTFDPDHPPTRSGPADAEPSADELLEAQAICERALAAVETKAVRHVRTAEGARHFGEPVGAVIVADRVRPFAPQLAVDPAGAIDYLTSAIQGRYTLDDGEEVEVYANHVTEFGFDFDVFNKDEALIGSAQRGAYKRTNDVEHESMRMEEGYQGRGFARQFMDRSMQAYSDVGVERVNVQTQWTGGYAWARLGFRPREEGGYASTFAGRVLNLQDGKDTSQDAKDYIYERQLAGESLGDLDWILTIPGTSTVRYGDAESGYTDPTRVPAPVAALLNLTWHGSISPNEYLRRRGLERKMLALGPHEDLVHELTLDNASQPLLDLYLASGYDTKGARHVRTREGAAFYDEPIGALIGPQSMLDHVEKVAEAAMAADKTVTPRVITAVVNAGGKLEGLDKRMKKTAAIADRMMRNSQTAVRNDKEPDLALAAAGVPDALRYTAVFNDDDYVNGAIRLMKALDAQGFVGFPGGWGNAWNTDSYKGLNLRLEDERGYSFELQIHTPSSYAAKRDSHPLYMQARNLPYGGERLAVVAQMQEIAAAVVTPMGAGGLSWRGRRAKRRSEPNTDKQFSFWQAGKKPYAYVGTKAARHVRTPEGAQHFGLPIGAVIKPDVMPSVIRPPGWKPPPPRGLAGTAAIDKLMGDLATVERSNVAELPGRNGTLRVGDVVTRHGVEQGARVVSFHGDRALLTDGRMARATDLSLVAPPKKGPRTERAELEALEYVRELNDMGDSTAETVTDYGEWWLPRDLPEGFERGEQKMCFTNAWRLAMENEDLTYVEGFGVAEIGEGAYFPTHHAWVVDEDGYVIDPTWKDGVGYYGVPIKHEAIARIALATGVYGVFGGHYRHMGIHPEPDSGADFDPETDLSDVVGYEDHGVERPFEKSRWIKHSDGVSRWGENGAAGVLFRHEDDHGVVRYLLAKRGRHVDQGGTWGIPGGAIDDGETPLEAALREVDEEFGGAPAVYEVAHEYTAQPVPEWAYTTHVIDVQERFTATKLDWETERVGWFTAPEMARLNLHPGFAAGLAGLLAPPDANPPSPLIDESPEVWDTSYEKASAHYRYQGAHEVHVGDEVRIGGGVNAMRVSKVWDNGEVSVTKVSRTQGANTFTMPYERLRLVRRTAANPPAVAEGFMKASKPSVVSDSEMWVEDPAVTTLLASLVPAESEVKAAANAKHNGAMVALWVPAAVARQLAVDGGEDPDELHVTLAYLGKAVDVDGDAALAAVRAAAARQATAMDASITGVARFKAGDDGVPEVYLVNAVGLGALRVAVVEELAKRDIEVPSEFDFIPHCTRRYVPTDEARKEDVPAVPTAKWTWDRITLALGDELTSIAFNEAHVVETKSLARVRTSEGSRYYGLPIGAPIVADAHPSAVDEFLNPPFGESEAAKTLIPSIADLVDKHGWDPEAAEKEWKRLHHNKTVALIRARQKAEKQAGVLVAKDAAKPTPPKTLDVDADPQVIADLLLFQQAYYLEHGGNPTALYDTLKQTVKVKDGQAVEPPKDGPGACKPWVIGEWPTKLVKDTEEPIPVVGLTVEGYRVERGMAIRRNGIAYLVELNEGEDTHAGFEKINAAAATYEAVLGGMPDGHSYGLKALQRGVALVSNGNPSDPQWAEKYGIPNFKSEATGGRGTTTWWGSKPAPNTIAHEFGHNVDSGLAPGHWISETKSSVLEGQPWSFAHAQDVDTIAGGFIGTYGFVLTRPGGHPPVFNAPYVTDYGKVSPREDFAESVRLYLKDRREGKLGYLNQMLADGTVPPSAPADAPKMNVRFADVWPARARVLDAVFGAKTASSPGGPLVAPTWNDKLQAYDTPYKQAQRKRAEDYMYALTKDGESWHEKAVMSSFGLSHAEAIDAVVKAQARVNAEKEKTAAIEYAGKLHDSLYDELLTRYQAVVADAGDSFDGTELGFHHATVDGIADLMVAEYGVAPDPHMDQTDEDKLALINTVADEIKAYLTQQWAKSAVEYAEQQLAQSMVEAQEFQASLHDLKKLPKDVAHKIGKKKAAVKFYAKKGGASPEDAQAAADEYALNAIAEALHAAGLVGTPSTLKVAAGGGTDQMSAGIKSGSLQTGKIFLSGAGASSHPKSFKGKNGMSLYGEAGRAKDNIVVELSDRLNNPDDWELYRKYRRAAKPHISNGPGSVELKTFDEYTEEERLSLLYADVDNRIGTWASTAGDGSPPALAMQHAIKDEFGLKADWGIRFLTGSGYDKEAMLKNVTETYATVGPWYRRVARVMYQHTQAEFAKNGVKTVGLHRGMHNMSWQPGQKIRPALQPANSWSSTKATAKGFGSYVLSATFPVSRILGSARTGFGCLNESEFVVFDSDGLADVSYG